MKIRTIALTVVVMCFVGLSFAAGNPNMGTWKLNEAKSKVAPGAAKNSTVVYEAAGDNIKCTIDGTDSKGKPTHIVWTGKFDGKDYALTGDASAEMRSYKTIDDRTTEGITKKDGKVISTTRIVVAADGKSRTVTSDGMDSAGKKTHSETVYDKQ